MVAFSCCIYDGGQVEKSEMDVVREKGWGKKFKQKYRVIAPGLNRKNGKCPMTPVEVSLYLAVFLQIKLGFSSGQEDEYISVILPLVEKILKVQCSTYVVSAKRENIAPVSSISALITSQSYSKINCTIDVLTDHSRPGRNYLLLNTFEHLYISVRG